MASWQAIAGPAEWCEFYDALLLDVADARTLSVAENLESLLSRLDESDPLRGEVAYWLAHSLLALGKPESARKSLAEAEEYDKTMAPALAFESQMDAIQRRVDHLPVHASFDSSYGPMVHSWTHATRGELDLGKPKLDGKGPGEPGGALKWTSRVRDMEEDQIFASFAPQASPVQGIRFAVRAWGFPAFLRLVATDESDHAYVSDTIQVPTNQWTHVDLRIASFSTNEPSYRLRNPNPRNVRVIYIQDVTAYLSADRGSHVMWIDDLEIW